MNKISLTISSLKYVYLVVFFTLLAGLFNSLINNTNFDGVVAGVFVLLVGLAGTILLYMASTRQSNKAIFLGIGFALVGISLYAVFYLAGLNVEI